MKKNELQLEELLLSELGQNDSVIGLKNLEVASKIERLNGELGLGLFLKVPVNQRGAVLLAVSKKLQKYILQELEIDEIVKLLHYLDLNEASEVIMRIDEERRKIVAVELGEDLKQKLNSLSAKHHLKMKNLMDLNYIQIEMSSDVVTIATVISKYEKKTGRFPTVLVVSNGKLCGSLPGHALVLLKKDDDLRSYIKKLPVVHYADGYEALLKAFRASPYDKVVVLNDDESVLGIIYSEEIVDILEKQTAKNLYSYAGVDQSEDFEDGFQTKVLFRYKWLIVNLFTAFLAAAVVAFHEETISKMVLLAAYMPVIAGMGGNAATQTLAVMVRGLSLKKVNFKSILKVVSNELLAGLINGLIVAGIIAIISIVTGNGLLFGLIAGLAVVINLLIAGLFGTLVPYVMTKLHKDPASSATIFITTATDVFGFMVFLGLASLIA